MAAVEVLKPRPVAMDLYDGKMDIDKEPQEEDLYTNLKGLQRQLEFFEIQVGHAWG